MTSIDKLLKYLAVSNIAKELDEEKCAEIAKDVVLGYQIDEDSRTVWLETNKEAMKIIKHCESDDEVRDFPFQGSAKVIYPLLAPATIQMAARMSTHIVQNDRVCNFAVLGPDQPEMTQAPPAQPGMPPQQVPTGKGVKQAKAERLTDYASYVFLKKSKTWLKDQHKLCHIVASWGTGFKQVTYDPITKTTVHEVLPPEDVIINHNISSLEQAPRITVIHRLRKNDIIELIRAGKFLDKDLDTIDTAKENTEKGGDSREIRPAIEFLCQTLWLDLDGDDYAEPYKAYVRKDTEELFGLYPAFALKDVDIKDGTILRIKPRIDIVDYHLMDDPEGKFYSIGLNYLLLHPNKTLTTICRQLLDSATLANTQGGFVTKAFKTNKRTLEFKMGEFQVLDVDPSVNPQQHIMPLPFKEPSQVMFSLFGALVQASKEIGFITDVLTGDVESQNTPATTMLAMVEQGTRAFKPVIQKLYISEKNEFQLWFDLNAEYMDGSATPGNYAQFQGQSVQIFKSDFDANSIDVCPVADPTMCSEAHKYAQLKMLSDMMNTPLANVLNPQQVAKQLLEGAGFLNADQFIAQSPPAPDPKLMKVQLDAQKHQDKNQLDQLKLQLQAAKLENDKLKVQIQAAGFQVKASESSDKRTLMNAAALRDQASAALDAHRAGHEHAQDMIDTQLKNKEMELKHAVDQRKLDILETKPRDQGSSK